MMFKEVELSVSEEQVDHSKRLSKENMEVSSPDIFEIAERRFLIMPGVFSPNIFPSAKIFYKDFPFREENRFLEIGCGAGYCSVLAAMNGARSVVATDINSEAISNAALNVKLHWQDEVINVIESDLFENVEGRFSTIYWNHPFIPADEDYEFDNIVERAIFDPGYKLLFKFLRDCENYLEDDGRVLLGLADVGGLEYFRSTAARLGYSENEIRREDGLEGQVISVTLHELKHTGT